jgi:hypothetical protein
LAVVVVTDDPVFESLPHAASTAIIATAPITTARFVSTRSARIRFVASSSDVVPPSAHRSARA